jgi:hypothetical protein
MVGSDQSLYRALSSKALASLKQYNKLFSTNVSAFALPFKTFLHDVIFAEIIKINNNSFKIYKINPSGSVAPRGTMIMPSRI